MPRCLTRRLTLATACAIGLGVTALQAAEDVPFIVARDILPAAVVHNLHAALAKGLRVNVVRGTFTFSPTRGLFVLGSGVARQPTPLTPAGLVATAPMVLVAHTTFPAVESAEILALVRKNPGAKMAHDGPGSASQRCAAQLRDLLPAVFSEVHKSPAAPAALLVKTGEVELACLEAPLAIPLIQSGAVTPVLVAGDERLAPVWDVPTAAEVGLPQFSATAWFGLYLAGPDLTGADPKRPDLTGSGASPEAIGKANLALQGVLNDDAVLQSLTDAGLTPFPLTHRTPEAHAAFQAAEAERSQ